MSLTSISVFKGMRADDLRRLEAVCMFLEPRDGADIFVQGDAADSVCAIISGDGQIRIGAIDRNSKALMVEVFRVGDIFGEVGVIDGGVRSASATVEGRVRVAIIPAASFLSALAASPELGDALCRVLARRLRRTYELFQDATFETLEVRLAQQIRYLAASGGRQTGQGMRLSGRLRQSDLADLLGATTRSIITILNVWRAAGMVIYDTERALLTVVDMAALRAIAKIDDES